MKQMGLFFISILMSRKQAKAGWKLGVGVSMFN